MFPPTVALFSQVRHTESVREMLTNKQYNCSSFCFYRNDRSGLEKQLSPESNNNSPGTDGGPSSEQHTCSVHLTHTWLINVLTNTCCVSNSGYPSERSAPMSGTDYREMHVDQINNHAQPGLDHAVVGPTSAVWSSLGRSFLVTEKQVKKLQYLRSFLPTQIISLGLTPVLFFIKLIHKAKVYAYLNIADNKENVNTEPNTISWSVFMSKCFQLNWSPLREACFCLLWGGDVCGREEEDSPQLLRTRSDASFMRVQRRSRTHTARDLQRLRTHRFSINGHFYNHKVQGTEHAYKHTHYCTSLLTHFQVQRGSRVLRGRACTTTAFHNLLLWADVINMSHNTKLHRVIRFPKMCLYWTGSNFRLRDLLPVDRVRVQFQESLKCWCSC